MDQEQFMDAVREHCSVYRKDKKWYGRGYEWVSSKDPNPPPTLDDHLFQEWYMGGMSGGDCWGGEANRYQSSSEVVGDLEDLDKLLEALQPSIGFLQYKRLIAEVVETGNYSRGEYYGNTSDYTYKVCSLRKLYDALKERDLL